MTNATLQSIMPGSWQKEMQKQGFVQSQMEMVNQMELDSPCGQDCAAFVIKVKAVLGTKYLESNVKKSIVAAAVDQIGTWVLG